MSDHPYDCSCVDCFLGLRTALTEAKEALEVALEAANFFEEHERRYVFSREGVVSAALAKIREVMG